MSHNSDPHALSSLLGALPVIAMAPEARAEPLLPVWPIEGPTSLPSGVAWGCGTKPAAVTPIELRSRRCNIGTHHVATTNCQASSTSDFAREASSIRLLEFISRLTQRLSLVEWMTKATTRLQPTSRDAGKTSTHANYGFDQPRARVINPGHHADDFFSALSKLCNHTISPVKHYFPPLGSSIIISAHDMNPGTLVAPIHLDHHANMPTFLFGQLIAVQPPRSQIIKHHSNSTCGHHAHPLLDDHRIQFRVRLDASDAAPFENLLKAIDTRRGLLFPTTRQNDLVPCTRETSGLFVHFLQSHQRHIILQIIALDRLFGRSYSRCAMRNQEKSKPIAGVARSNGRIGGRAGIEAVAGGLAMRRRASRRRFQKRTEKERWPRRTGRREHEPGLPEAVLAAPEGPVAALLRSTQGGRSFAENYAEFVEAEAPCLALARSDRPDGIRAALPDQTAADLFPRDKPVLH